MRSKEKPRHQRVERTTESELHDETEHLWAVSYADFLMVLLSFFILFFSMNNDDTESVIKQIVSVTKSGSNEASGRAPNSSTSSEVSSDKSKQIAAEIVQTNVAGIENILHKYELRVDKERKTLILDFDENMFEVGSTDLKHDYEKRISDLLKSLAPFQDRIEITFVGYADKVGFRDDGESKYRHNWDLSAVRASKSARQATALGYTDDQLSIRAHTSDDRNLRTIGVEIRSRTARKPANIVPRFNPTGQEIGEVQTEDAGVEVAVKKDFLASAQKIFTVQVASYETEEQAFEVTNSVTQFGEVRVIPWDVNGKRWYRIYVGRSHSISEMKELRNRVAQALGDSQIFVKQIDKPVDKSF